MWLNKKIKIVSDGVSQYGTTVIDVETGEAIGGIQSIKWEVDVVTRIPKCTIVAYGVPLDVEANASIVVGEDITKD